MSKAVVIGALMQLDDLIVEIREQQSLKTLAAWRLDDEKLVTALRDFASSASVPSDQEEDEQKLLAEVLELFRDKINPLLAAQEKHSGFALESEDGEGASSASTKEVSIVFGGKHPIAGTLPATISEDLVTKLASRSSRVFTISRTAIPTSAELPSNVIHIVQNMDTPNADRNLRILLPRLQKKEEDVIYPSPAPPLVLYFTLGQHKGENPFVRNIVSAGNFCKALTMIVEESMSPTTQPWRVVLTGTDATLPSTYPDGKVTLPISDGGSGDEEFVVPTYKISEYNYVYAASKLCQFYLVFTTVAKLLGRKEIAKKAFLVAHKLRDYIYDCKEDGTYHPDTASIQMSELDEISKQSIQIANELSDNVVMIATGISICYTPLHAVPWTHAAMKKDNPRADILEQIVRRLKNAISIDKAADCHFPPTNRERC